MRDLSFVIYPLMVLVVLLAACDNKNTSRDPLPNDPLDWVCQDSLTEVTQQEIDEFCLLNVDKGEPAPPFLQEPPPISKLDMKNIYDLEFSDFLRDRTYATELDWIRDMNWRLTGPYVGDIGTGKSFGTHPAVRVYYSPEVINWLCNSREGEIPDGAMIVKEQVGIDESLDIELNEEGCIVITADVEPTSWTVMVKQSGESLDGWYWGGYAGSDSANLNPPILDISAITDEILFFGDELIPTEPNPLWYPTGYVFSSTNKIPNIVFPFSEYGNDCLNCHASAESERTFSSLKNVLTQGTEYKLFDSTDPPKTLPDGLLDGIIHAPGLISLITQDLQDLTSVNLQDEVEGYVSPFSSPLTEPSQVFLDFYDQLNEVTFSDAWLLRLPAQTYDHIVSASTGSAKFITSDQCASCHDATYSNSSLPNMILEEKENGTTQLINLSPYSEWRASPMSLAGRDPIFFAQIQSETNNLPQLTNCIELICLKCHSAMAQRQLAIDTPGQDTENCKSLFPLEPPPEVPFGKSLELSMLTQWPNSENNEFQKYGALARDGVSCRVCHNISDVDLGNENTFTANFVTGPPDEIFGPYENITIVPKPMENSIGVEPLFADHFVRTNKSSSDVCGTCHNVLIPIFNNDGTIAKKGSFEQSTQLEWLNSDFSRVGPGLQTCANCHMQTHYKGEDLSFKIANIESSDFAPTTNRLPDADITLTERDTFARHSLHGLNIFINEMFQQFPILLGARQISYQTGTATVPSLITGGKSMIEMAQNETAVIDIQDLEITPEGQLRAVIEVVNLVGHYLPSGVGFRRVFIEFLVRDIDGKMLWASGRTNELGAILRGTSTNEVLLSEEPVKFPDAPFQPHYQTITQDDQVQIYQGVAIDSEGNLTTSVVRSVDGVKDNRIRPKGFDPKFFAMNPSEFIRELAKIPGEAALDPHYTNPELTGSDVIEYLISLDEATLVQVHDIKVTLYNQSIPPFYLQQRFRDANRGAAKKDEIKRLFYLTSHLNVDDVMDEEGRRVVKDYKFFLTSETMKLQ